MSGRFEAPRKKLRLSRRAMIWLAAALVSAILAGVCFARLHSVTTCLYSQQAAERWRGESDMRFAQVSVFLPVGGETNVQAIEMFHESIEQAMQEVSLEAPEGGSLYVDAYSGSAQVSVYTVTEYRDDEH